jgi:hypothetical protein
MVVILMTSQFFFNLKIKDIERDSPRSPPYLEEEEDCLSAPNLR